MAQLENFQIMADEGVGEDAVLYINSMYDCGVRGSYPSRVASMASGSHGPRARPERPSSQFAAMFRDATVAATSRRVHAAAMAPNSTRAGRRTRSYKGQLTPEQVRVTLLGDLLRDDFHTHLALVHSVSVRTVSLVEQSPAAPDVPQRRNQHSKRQQELDAR